MSIDITRQRLHNQHISRPTFSKPSDVVLWMGAMQAQDYMGVKWSIGLRMANASDADIERAIASKTILRTWPMRGTLHFVAADDIRWMLELTASRMIAANARRYRQLELDEATLARTSDLLAKALAGGQELTRTELLAMLERNGISTTGQRAPFILQRASLEALICQTVTERNDPTYLLMDEAVPKTKVMERDEALAELVKRYFTSHGPASIRDFVGWSGLTITDTRAGLEAVGSQLAPETVDGETYWMPQSASPANAGSPSLYLLPGFDEYVLGYRDRGAFLDPQHANKVVPGGNGIFKPTIVSDGRIVGLWSRAIKKKSIAISPHPFTSLTPDEQQAFKTAAQRYGQFLGLPVESV